MKPSPVAPLRQSASVLVLVLVLTRLRPAPGSLAQQIAHPYRRIEEVGIDRAVAAVASDLLWLASVWLTAALLAAIWIQRTGHSSRLLRGLVRSTPQSLQRLVLTSAGVSLILGPTTAAFAAPAGSALPAPRWPVSIAVTTPAVTSLASTPSSTPPDVPAPRWPNGPASAAPSTGPAANISSTALAPPATSTPVSSDPGVVPAPTLPRTARSPIDPSQTSSPPSIGTPPMGAIHQDEPSPPTSTPPGGQTAVNPPTQSTPQTPATPLPSSQVVIVQPGDSLWSITSQRLGPSATDAEVAVEWPYWYRSNRRVIGSDPGVLHPGQRLVVPARKG